jgi:uncharacterized protein YgiM (DUF1202 family)
MVTHRSLSRRHFLGSSAVVAVAAAFPFVPHVIRAQSSVRTINSNGVRLRSGPGLRFGVVRVLYVGDAVDFLGSAGSADGYQWSNVRVRRTGDVGYVASQFLNQASGGSYPVGSTFHTDTATGGSANLRSSASTSSSVVRSVANGTTGTVQSGPTQAGGYTWHQVTIAGSSGWMATVVMAPGAGNTGRQQVRVADGPLNVRQTAGLSGTVILTASTGATGEITEQMPVTRDGYVWVNVRFFNQANTTGWVAKNFLAFT